MLYGEYKHTVDKKGRISIPSKLRDDLGDSFIISKGIEGNPCLCIYSNEEWQALDEKIRQLPTMKSSKAKRFLYSGANKLECDANGRVVIPPLLRDYAGIEATATILGMSTHIEIWNTEAWEAESEQYTPESIAEIMEGLDF